MVFTPVVVRHGGIVCAMAFCMPIAWAQAAHDGTPSSPVGLTGLDQYQRWRDDERIPWKDANERVNRIGGWRTYAKEAQEAKPAAPQQTGASAGGPRPSAAIPPRSSLQAVEQLTARHLPAGAGLTWPRTPEEQARTAQRLRELLAQPLDMNAAIELALLQNPALQATYAELDISEAELSQATRLPNPGFTFASKSRDGELEYERSIHFNLMRWLSLPMAQRDHKQRLAQTQANVAMQVLDLVAQVRKAWIQAVAAEESVRYGRQVMQAAEASAELARRMAQVGNFTPLQQAREKSFYADAALQLARAEQAQLAARERLIRLLGLDESQLSFKLPERLPDLPTQLQPWAGLERRTLDERLDVKAAQANVQATAQRLGLTKTTRLVNVLELGGIQNTSNQASTQRGWEVSLELPLFDWGEARVAKAEATYMQALHRAAQSALEARSQVREAYVAYRYAWDMARHHRDHIVPLKSRIAEENLLRYNGMLIGVFELLADARSQIVSVSAAIDATRDFWLAQADLELALVGKPSLSGLMALSAQAPDSTTPGH